MLMPIVFKLWNVVHLWRLWSMSKKYMNHKLLLVTELIFYNNPKAIIRFLSSQPGWSKPLGWPTKIHHRSTLFDQYITPLTSQLTSHVPLYRDCKVNTEDDLWPLCHPGFLCRETWSLTSNWRNQNHFHCASG